MLIKMNIEQYEEGKQTYDLYNGKDFDHVYSQTKEENNDGIN